ncbi:MAG: CvpA family protein [Gammaproteobacteria bacterium]|nr:CvpA family protein [Gammaproteobacteria bacterium]MDD9806926.1 CvpA family protein [Gammaproteobacteria bacterium]MDD9869567.1 CvpA family protein [Gammaproteobacteria bacterium]MDD9886738.1 CvpA family protein [Gammaproteobacteria bacterium]
MAYLDIFIFVIVFVSMVLGIYKGFVREVASLATLLLAFFAAFRFADYPLRWLPEEWRGRELAVAGLTAGAEDLARAASFVAIALLVLVVGRFIARRINRAVNAGALSGANRFFGGVFGLVRGSAIVVLLVLLFSLTEVPSSPWWRGALFLPPFLEGAGFVVSVLPEPYSDYFMLNPGLRRGADPEDFI